MDYNYAYHLEVLEKNKMLTLGDHYGATYFLSKRLKTTTCLRIVNKSGKVEKEQARGTNDESNTKDLGFAYCIIRFNCLLAVIITAYQAVQAQVSLYSGVFRFIG